MYLIKHQKENVKFQENQEKLLLGYERKFGFDARREMMDFLGIKPRY